MTRHCADTKGLGRRGRALLAAAAVAIAVATGCSSPDEKAQAYYQEGLELLAKGDHVGAGVQFRNALQIKGDMAGPLYGLAQVEEKQGNWEKVFPLLNKVLELDAGNVDARVKLGKLLLAANQVDKALAESDTLLKQAADDAQVLALRAAVLFKLEDRQGAVAQAKAALEKDPNQIDALTVLATERLAAGDAKAAIGYLDRGLAQNERSIAFNLIKIQALDQLGQTADAEAVFRRLIELYPDVRAFRHSLALYYVSKQREADAEKVYREIVDASPKDTAAKLDVVRFLNTTRGRDAALAELKALIAKEPDNDDLRFALAQVHTAAGENAAAEEIYKAVVARQGTAAPGLVARNRLAALKIAAGDKAGAGALAAEVLAADARNADALTLRAVLAIERRALEDAIADLRTVLRDEPSSARALLLLANAHQLQGSMELAEDHYARAFLAAKGQPAIGMQYALFLINKGALPRAEEVLNDIRAVSPNYLPALQALAQVKLGRQDWVGAEELAEQIRKAGGQPQLTDQILGSAYAGQKREGESIEAFQRAHDAAPAAEQPLVALVKAYGRAGKPDEAERVLVSALEGNPDNHAARATLALVYALRGKTEVAEKTYRELIARKPADAAAYRSLATLYVRQKRLDDAMKVVDEGLKAMPGDFALRITRASLFELTQDWEGAIAEYEALHAERPSSDVVANNLAALLSDHRGDEASHKRALALAERFKRSDIPYFRDTLGWAYYRVGKPDEAIALLKGAVEKAPADPNFRYHLGMSYLALKQPAKAKEELQKALDLSAKQPLAQDAAIRETLKQIP